MSSTPSVMLPTRLAFVNRPERAVAARRAPAVGDDDAGGTIVPWPGGGFYGACTRTRRPRWVVGVPGTSSAVPSWAGLHPLAWSGRRTVLSLPWGSAPVCLVSPLNWDRDPRSAPAPAPAEPPGYGSGDDAETPGQATGAARGCTTGSRAWVAGRPTAVVPAAYGSPGASRDARTMGQRRPIGDEEW
jgi:hypothetical protein